MIPELELVAREVGVQAERVLEDLPEDRAARAALGLLSERGLTAWAIPAAYGGADAGALAPPEHICVRALCALRAALSYHSGMLDVMLAMQGLGSYPLALAGSAGLRERVLPEVRAGRAIAAFALTEPGAGSNLGEIATRAVRQGERWRLEGHKTFISNAGIASFYCLLARTSGAPGDGRQDGLGMFFLPADAPGLRVERFEVMAPHPIGELLLEGVLLPAESLLGGEGDGLAIASATLERFRPTVAAAANGFARRALDESLAHLQARSQFGRPLAAKQALRFDLAEMDLSLRAAELLVEEAARALDEGREAAREVARAKLFATEAAGWICDRAVQHHGGLGVRRGTVVERLFREVRALRIYEGTSEVQKLILAKLVLGRRS
jgi:acyl-CoA dehydrogenase